MPKLKVCAFRKHKGEGMLQKSLFVRVDSELIKKA